MSGLAKKSTHAKGGKKRRAATETVETHLKEPVGVVGEPSDVSDVRDPWTTGDSPPKVH